jgi:UDPglucose 6-dehydrogenase|tara:strand:- start:3190 stop:4377 length:1188 start_codon:yes stop_codon:yes gene_type:complete
VKIGFIGLGKLGLPCAEVIAKKGHSVLGYDVNKNIDSDYVIVEDTIQETVKDRDIVFIAVPTPHDPSYDGRAPTAHLEPKDFSYDIVKEVMTEANKHMNNDQLLVLISTVLPGTVRREFVQLVTNPRFVYNPYLIAMGTVAWDMVNPEMVMIGTEDGTETGDAKQLVDFYKSIMDNFPRYVIGTWDECECIKVFYNTFISTKIGLVNMIQDVAQRQGNINTDVVTTALAESTQRIMGPSYMKAGMGDGGACHPRDNIALRYMAKKLDLGYDIFDAIMNAREVQAKNIAQKLCDIAKEKELPILINGIAYKPGVPYVDGSYALLVAQYCTEYGYNPMQVDPLVYGPDKGPFRAVVLLAHPEMYVDVTDDSVVVDPWREHSSSKYEVVHYGNTRELI